MRRQDGFTLIEVLVAMVILGVGFSILIEGFISLNNGIKRNEDYTYIASWANSKMNKIAAGIELNRHGSFQYNGNYYNWWVEELYSEENLIKVKLNVEIDGIEEKNKYSITRLLVVNN